MATPSHHRRTPTLGAAVCAVTMFVASCGGDEPAPTVGSELTTSVVLTLPEPPDTADLPVSTPAPPDTADLPTSTAAPTTTVAGPIAISVTVGVDSGPDRVDTVPVGSLVSITIVNPGSADEFHLHGYDLGDGQEIPAGQPATFTFTADTAGRFELESHETHDVILVLEVV